MPERWAIVGVGPMRRLADSDLEDQKLRTLLARRSLRHPLRPHWRSPTAREATLLARKKTHGEVEQAVAPPTRH